ncbi:MAG: FAD-binding oxidoreductase [Pseudomonadota bacterium]
MARRGEAAPVPDVTIIGAGIIGVCCALSLQERGLSVAIIDRLPPGEATSHGNAGIISPWSCVPQAMPGIWKSVPGWMLDPEGPLRARMQDLPKLLPWAARFLANTRHERVHAISDAMEMLVQGNVEAYRHHLKGTGREGLIRDSWLVNVYRRNIRPCLDDLSWRLRIDRGAPVDIVSGRELRDIEPELSEAIDVAAIQKAQARAVNPGEICKALAEKARRQGAEVLHRDVTALRPGTADSFVLETTIGALHAKKVVLCAGIWSTELLKPLGIRLPLISERGYHLEFIDPGVELNNSILDVESKFIISSMEVGVRAAGTSEFADVDAPPNYKRADMLASMSKRIIPRLNTTKTRRWVGARPSFPDNLPVVGRVPKHRGLYAAFGHSHYGLGMGPATARLLTEDILGKHPNATRSSVSMDRFM